jgi:hypothetical protein
MNNVPQYQIVQPTPISCTFCGAMVHPKINESIDPQTKQSSKECRWSCARCGNLVKIGKVQ